MKKKLESELISIAHRILKLKGKEDVVKMHTEVKELFEKLSVLKFAQENFEDEMPTIGNDSSFFGMLDTAFNNKISDTIEVEDKLYINLDDKEEEITEPLMETIKDMVAQMPEETHEIDAMLDGVLPKKKFIKNDLEDLASGYQEMPVFEPVSQAKKEEISNEKKSLNDTIKKGGLNIGLNDKIAFVKHLFDGQNADYDRVVSQLNTLASFNEASRFINDMVKPDYNNWEGKEEFEERFMSIVEGRFL
ncbi:hypothetical protein GCM10022291_11700 [Postechiella marina]|uniref:Uncharacterized protein n=1 Tax=Postechiella marina TaxID=943941 RepID=A0ABP8C4Y5_9FLAO